MTEAPQPVRATSANVGQPGSGAVAWALIAAGTALRALSVPASPGDVDGVNLARGLSRFDPFSQSPHFPGYPVLVALSRVARALGVDGEAWALAAPGIVLWPVAGLVLYRGLRLRVAGDAALVTLAVSSLAPGAVLHAGWPGSEGLGFALLCAGTGGLLHRARSPRVAGAVVLGLLLGVRLSWWPLVAGVGLFVLCTERRAAAGSFAGAAAAGALLWLVPMLLLFDPLALLELGRGFLRGHFDAWGGSALAPQAGPVAERALHAMRGLAQVALGAGSLWLGLVALFFAALPAFRRRHAALGALALAPYVVWLLVAQNVDKPRHLLPLLPALGVLCAAALRAAPARAAAVPLLCAALLYTGTRSALAQRAQRVPAVAMAHHLAGAYGPAGLLVFAGEEARVLQHLLPSYRVVRPASDAVLLREASRARAQGVQVLISDGAVHDCRTASRLPQLARFPARAQRPHDAALALHRFTGDATYALRSDR